MVRFFLSWAAEACISLKPPAVKGAALPPAKVADAVKLRPEGFFEATWPSQQSAAPAPGSYKIQGRTHSGDPFEIFDPYAFPIVLSEFDLYLMGEGRHYDTYEKLGAHVITLEGVQGVHFAVWAPSAKRVSVVGDFNGWDAASTPCALEAPPASGKSFCPSSTKAPSTNTKLSVPAAILSLLKRIPMLFRSELRPNTGSVVARLDHHKWNDADWLASRAQKNWFESAISVYEVHLGSWRRVPRRS